MSMKIKTIELNSKDSGRASFITGWQASSYLTSTPAGSGHVFISTLNGLVNVSLDNGNNGSSFVALQIL